jgi:peptide/nickel transport system substrate-binding protein
MSGTSFCLAAVLSAVFGNAQQHPLKISQTMLAGGEDPTDGSNGWAWISHGVAEKLFTVDCGGNIVPQVGASVNKLSDLSWEVTLQSNYKFSDGTTVTAQHVATAFTKLNAVNSRSQSILGNTTYTATDAVTMRIDSELATPVMKAVLANFVFVVFLEEPAGTFLFTGPYKVESYTAGAEIDLTPNTYYADASERKLLTIKKLPSDGVDAKDQMLAGTLDMAFHIPLAVLPPLRDADGIKVMSFLAGYQYMMFHNMKKSPLSELKVRQAIDVAIDRDQLTQELSAGMATRSLYPQYTPYYLESGDMNAEKSAAETLLDEAGWALNSDGKRENSTGGQLAVHIVAYPQRPGLPVIMPLIAAKLEALGFEVTQTTTDGSSWAEHDAIVAADNWDLLLWAQHPLPAGDPAWFPTNFFQSNSGYPDEGFADSDVDTALSAFSTAETEAARVTAANDAQTAILAKVPVSILMTPGWHVAVGTTLADYQPNYGDYYIVKDDFGLSGMGSATCEQGITLDTDFVASTTAQPETTAQAQPDTATTIATVATDPESDGATRVMLSGLSVASLLLFASRF